MAVAATQATAEAIQMGKSSSKKLLCPTATVVESATGSVVVIFMVELGGNFQIYLFFSRN